MTKYLEVSAYMGGAVRHAVWVEVDDEGCSGEPVCGADPYYEKDQKLPPCADCIRTLVKMLNEARKDGGDDE